MKLPLRGFHCPTVSVMKKALAVFIFCALGQILPAETYAPEPNHRVTINLGVTPWKFLKDDPYPEAKAIEYNDSAWTDVGIPHCFNDSDTFVNVTEGNRGLFQGTVWYRKHFVLNNDYKGRKIFIEFQGVNIACAVYVNGALIRSGSEVKQPGEVTHVYGFTPFVIDVTDLVKFDGKANVIAVRVSNAPEPWYVSLGFGDAPFAGMADGGIFLPVYLHITDPVHVPLNVYSNVKKWGTSVATLAASPESATVRIQANVDNETSQAQTISLVTQVVDADRKVVLELKGDAIVPPGTVHLFDQTGDIKKPHLWQLNNGKICAQYLYKVYHVVKSGGKTVDVFEDSLGVRTITWDADYPYINGVKSELYGFGARYDYPALGTALPEEQHWREIKLATEAGGRLMRPGHAASAPASVAACDVYGVGVVQPSGDNEFSFYSANAQPALAGNVAQKLTDVARIPETRKQYKREVQRDIIIRDRNHPSILFWEASNGGIEAGLLPELKKITETWDNLSPRELSPRATLEQPRDAQPDLAQIKVVGAAYDAIGTKKAFPGHPVWTAESWLRPGFRFDWDASVTKAEVFLKNVEQSRRAKVFGFAHWYLSETCGENYQKPDQRALGCAALDGNRIPELIYKIYQKAALIPCSVQPGVVIGTHWNQKGLVPVKVWSNCPKIELFLNETSLGIQTPGEPFADKPFQCEWTVAWAPGILKAVGLDADGREVCTDIVKTAGDPDHLELSLEPELIKPDGEKFQLQANGSDVAFILAKIVDRNGVVCPESSLPITFNVTGPANYRGSWNQAVSPDKGLGYHAPGDHELSAEAGMIKIAVRTTFEAGAVTVTAESGKLKSAKLSFHIHPVNDPLALGCAIKESH